MRLLFYICNLYLSTTTKRKRQRSQFANKSKHKNITTRIERNNNINIKLKFDVTLHDPSRLTFHCLAEHHDILHIYCGIRLTKIKQSKCLHAKRYCWRMQTIYAIMFVHVGFFFYMAINRQTEKVWKSGEIYWNFLF